MKCYVATCALALAAAGIPAMGAEFDGSRLLLCANVEAADCAPGQNCAARLRPDDIGAPAFFRIDFDRKMIVGPKRTTSIASIEKSDRQLLLQGAELGYAWSIALDTGTGKTAATLVDRQDVFVLFGNCMAMP
ncbi:MAG: hypothetical protein IT530_09625 [Burkholderiales bacterium]|nr:hypothetical protein [Burkholderiales bacterium]